MKARIWLFIFFLFLLNDAVFPVSPREESFRIWNYSSKNVVVEREFYEDDIVRLEIGYAFQQNVNGITLSIQDMLEPAKTNAVLPQRTRTIIYYYPFGSPLDMRVKKMYELPFMDKMRAIFKELKNICNDGKDIITLDNLGERIIKKWGDAYILEIFDYDLVGKPAAEW